MMVVMIAVLVGACGDPELPFDRFEDIENYGAYARRISQTGTYDFFNIAGSSIDLEVEFYDEAEGQNIDRYDWTVEFISNGGNGGNDVAPVAFASFSSANFGQSANGYPGLTFSLNMQDALTALGVDGASLTAGDVFRFDATVTKTDGSTFTIGNTGTNIISSAAFAAVFRVDAPVVCLFAETLFVGDYLLEQGAVEGAFGQAFLDQVVTVSTVPDQPTKRQFAAIYLEPFGIGNGPAPIIFDMICSITVTDPGQSSGLQCTSGILMNPAATPGVFDITDDSQFTVTMNEGLSDCGAGDTDISFTFTKQ